MAAAFVFDRTILDLLQDRDDRRVTFIRRSLEEVDAGLRARGSRLVVACGDPVEEVPKLARALGVDEVWAGRDYEPLAIARDEAVGRLVDLRLVKDHVVFEGREVVSGSGAAFRVYTPYRKAWLSTMRPEHVADRVPDLGRLWPASELKGHALGDWPLERLGFTPGQLWLAPGEAAGRERLAAFAAAIDGYAQHRDLPALPGATSGLSVHFRFGTVSIREAVRFALARGSEGAEKWLHELIWREFYSSILANFPHVAGGAFKPEFDSIVWPGEPAHFDAWREGLTGYPLVDAAMRCLDATGWMHNRLRMVAASFLVKDLLLDWRLGEAWFARKLLDFDLASNSGGWQWSASVGVDAQPYFRVFNPVLQSHKFDSDGAFIREWCPELAGFGSERIHAPWEATPFEQIEAGCEVGRQYPAPIVDHHVQKTAVVRLLEEAAKA